MLVGGCAGPRDVAEPARPTLEQRVIRDIAAIDAQFSARLAIDRVVEQADSVFVHLLPSADEAFYRPADVDLLTRTVTAAVAPYGKHFGGFRVGDRLLRDLVPNFYRSPDGRDPARLPTTVYSGVPIVSFPDRPDRPTTGLLGRHIALWPSHGWYYEPALDRWEWQRARLFQTVEDKLPLSFVLKYLAPMLENAGAEVYLPRERDVQSNEAVVDNDGSQGGSQYVESSTGQSIRTGGTPGFAFGNPPYPDALNPFLLGTYRELPSEGSGEATVSWVPAIPESGRYAVYLAWAATPSACTTVDYRIHHRGGETRLSVDQSRGAGTWIYTGRYDFDKGSSADSGSVVVSNVGAKPTGCAVTADAVRFGGGEGNVIRGEFTSGRPRYMEGARYYLQYAGAPAELVYDLSPEEADYTDDYRSRGEWVNWLRGAPFGPNNGRDHPGLGIPIDLSLAFHTDAGVLRPDSSIGTLSIYSTTGFDTTQVFPDGMSRMANRDLADILQTEIVDDIRALYDSTWQRRSLWDRDYSEAVRPNVPSVLLELLSHQNFYDMHFGLDPSFQFDASRSIYKAILRFLSTQYDVPYVVSPLGVTHFTARLTSNQVMLHWKPSLDPLEESAAPDSYVVQTRLGEGSWDDGVLVHEPRFVTTIGATDVVHSYRVLAVNAGGRSFPSEVLAVGRAAESNGGSAGTPIRIVSAFDRVAAPAFFEGDEFGGVAAWNDHGVPDGFDISYTGPQYDHRVDSPWLDDDAPGFGASYATLETERIAGNTHDFVAVHGRAILDAGFSFDSASDEAVADGVAPLVQYDAVDLLLGEEKSTRRPRSDSTFFKAFPTGLRERVTEFAQGGGHLLVTGAYVASDLTSSPADSAFAADVLHIRLRTTHGSSTGEVYSVRNALDLRPADVTFETQLNDARYAVEAPDAIEPVGDAIRFMRYRENNMSAGVAFDGRARGVVVAFPFESIVDDEARSAWMTTVLDFLLRNRQ